MAEKEKVDMHYMVSWMEYDEMMDKTMVPIWNPNDLSDRQKVLFAAARDGRTTTVFAVLGDLSVPEQQQILATSTHVNGT